MSPWMFWICATVVLGAYAVYPAVVLVLARARRNAEGRGAGRDPLPDHHIRWPRLDVILCVQNGGRAAARKVRELLRDDYPAGLLRVIVADDGSTDETPSLLQAIRDPRLTLVRLPERGGKPAALNAAVKESDAPVLVFMDQRQRVLPGSLRALAVRLREPGVGAVSGRLEISGERSGGERDGGVGLYWRYELALRKAEGALGILTGVTGALYAVRRELWKPLPEDALVDDVSVALRVRAAGKRVVFEDQAVALDRAAEPEAEFGRKVRTLAGNLQVLFAPAIYGRWTAPGVWPVYLFHKIARLAAAWAFLGMLAASGLAALPEYNLLFLLQLGFWSAGLWGLATVEPSSAPRLVRAAAALLLLNGAAIAATIHYFASAPAGLWKPVPARISRAA